MTLSHRPHFIKFVRALCFVTNLVLVSAQNTKMTDNTGWRTIEIVAGALLLGLCLPLVFIGHKIYRILIFIAGLLLFGMSSFAIARLIVNLEAASLAQHIGVYAASTTIGLVGGILGAWFVRLGMIMSGVCLGYLVGHFINSFQAIKSSDGQTALTVALVMLLANLAFFFNNIFMIIASAGIGALLFMISMDLFFYSGILRFLIFDSNSSDFHYSQEKIWSIIASAILLFIIGLFLQLIVKGTIKTRWFCQKSESYNEANILVTEKDHSNIVTEVSLVNHQRESQSSQLILPEIYIVNSQDVVVEISDILAEIPGSTTENPNTNNKV